MRKVDYLLKQCSIFLKRAGLLAYPPKMKEYIIELVDESFNKYLVNNNEDMFIYKISVDLEGMPPNYHLDRLSKQFKYIRLQVNIDKSNTAPNRGSWQPYSNVLSVNIEDIDGTYDKSSIEITVEHELSHMIQSLLIDSIPNRTIKSKPGYPSEWRATEVPEPETQKYQEHGSAYFGSGIEFFPHLRNAIYRLLKQKSINRYSVLQFMYSDQFMVSLRLHKPKQFERAVSEIWKAVQDKLDTDPENEAKSKESFENWKFISDNKLSIIDFAQKNGFEKLIPIAQCPDFIKNAVERLFKIYDMPPEDIDGVMFLEDKPNNAIEVMAVINNEYVNLILLKKPS